MARTERSATFELREIQVTAEPDPYEVLQVAPSADPEVIEAAYHALTRKWRPKMYTSPEAAERIRQLNAAYETLRTASKEAERTTIPDPATDHSTPAEHEKARIIRVFISSPEDVRNERELIENLIRELNTVWIKEHGRYIDLVKWESLPYSSGIGIDQTTELAINQLTNDDYDLFIGLLWRRFGARVPRIGAGTADEFEQAYERSYYNERPAMFYFKKAPIPAELLKSKEVAEVRRFRDRLGKPRVSQALRQFLQFLGRSGILGDVDEISAAGEGKAPPSFYWDFTDPGQLVSTAREQLNRQVQGWEAVGAVDRARRIILESYGFPGVSGQA